MYYTPGEDIYYEIFQVKNRIKIIIYLKRVQGGFMDSCKCFGTHLLEQSVDENNNIVSEVIKENPHKVEFDKSLIEDDSD